MAEIYSCLPSKTILVAALTLVVLGAGFLWTRWGSPAPVYGGKRLTAWLADASFWMSLEDSHAAEKLAKATNAIRKMGEAAIPCLLDLLRQEDSRARSQLANWMERGAGRYLAPLHAYELRSQAVWAFAVLGPAAGAAIPQLEAMLLETNRSGPFANTADVGQALAGIGPASVDALLKGMTNSHKAVRFAALQGLEHLVPQLPRTNSSALAARALRLLAERAVPILLRWIEEDDPWRGTAATLLGQMRLRANLCVPVLMRLYERLPPHPTGRRVVLGALAEFGGEARAAAPLFASARDDADIAVRSTARRALEAIDDIGP